MPDDPFHENEIQTWREMSGELNEPEIGALEHMEQHGSTPAQLLEKAREFASKGLLRGAFGSVAPPDGAIRWFDFEGAADDGTEWEREFNCAETDFNGLRIRTKGRQRTDGSIASAELLASGHAQLSSGECRQLAAALYSEASKIDQLTADG